MSKYNTIIIGAGPAGITCGIYLKRFNLNPCIISTKESSLNKTLIENYYGIESISGSDLFNNGINQAINLGIPVIFEEVVSIEYFNEFIVKTNINEYKADSVFLATGKVRKKLNIKNVDNLMGAGVSMCATCDGFFFRKKKIGIVGNSSFMEHELEILERFSDDITIFTNGEDYFSEKYPVVKDKIEDVLGDDRLRAIKAGDKEYLVDGLFLALGSANGADFAKHIGLVVDKNLNIVVDGDFMTNVEGIFAGGDIIGGVLQVSKAVSDGALAAFSIKKYLKDKNFS